MLTTPHYKPQNKTDLIEQKDDSCVIKARALDIVWGGDPRYWRIPAESNSHSVELLQVSWLEVTGTVDLTKFVKDKTYELTFKLKLKPDAFGWADNPVYFMAKPGKDPYIWKKYDLSQGKPLQDLVVPSPHLKFTVHSTDENLQFGMYEIWRGRWKGGLIIDEVVIKPAKV